MLPHYTLLSKSSYGTGPGVWINEAVYTNLFELTFILPTILQNQGRDPVLLLEEAKNISFGKLTDFGVGKANQKFKFMTRQFLTTPDTTSGELSIKFNVNVNQSGAMESWNTLRAWYDIVFNSQTGTTFYKSDIVGTIIANQHDKKGVILRRVTFQNCQLQKLSGYDMDYSSNGILDDVEATFVWDYHIDEFIDNNMTITPAVVTGY